MLDQLPQYIDPVHLADKRGELHGEIPIKGLGRLAGLLADDDGVVAVDLIFGRDRHLPMIEGRLQTLLKLKCQNCLNAVEFAVNHAVKLGMVTSIEQANRLPEDFEPLMVGEGKAPLTDIIEDELLLILPDYPKHEYDCLSFNSENKDVLLVGADRKDLTENPFSILTKLKN
jgi:uncharacterized protein